MNTSTFDRELLSVEHSKTENRKLLVKTVHFKNSKITNHAYIFTAR